MQSPAQRRRLTIMLLLGAVALLGFLLYINVRPSGLFRIAAPKPAPVSDLNSFKDSVSATSLSAVSGSAILAKPRYTGQDILGHNWLLTAESAGQEGTTSSGTYVLNTVQAKWEDPSQTTPFTVSANSGHYTQTTQALLLTGEVSATGLGFNVTAPTVQASLVSRTLNTSGGTRVQGSVEGNSKSSGWDVNITAPNLTADQNSSRMVLTGGVHAIFTPNKSKAE